MASNAPTNHASRDCGPPNVAMIAGTVIKGPVPTIFDMLMEIAFSRPKLRGSRLGPAAAWVVVVAGVIVKPSLSLRPQYQHTAASAGVFMIGIGAAVTRRPLPHHRAYGSVHGGSS